MKEREVEVVNGWTMLPVVILLWLAVPVRLRT